MSKIRATVALHGTEISENRTKLIAATNKLARDGHIVDTANMDVTNFLRTGTILFNHDPLIPVGVPVSARLQPNGDLEVEIEWAPEDVSADAKKVKGLVKSGVLRAGSIGFDPIEMEPLDPKKPRAGQRITKSELLELSVVAVPSDPGAVVTARSTRSDNMADKAEWKVGASRNLPIDDSDDWNGGDAQKAIFEFAGGDDFDPKEARKGFLVYDAANPTLRGSYKLPIATVKDGKLVVPKGAIRAAASRLPDTDIPDDVKKAAGEVLDAYKEKAGIGEEDDGTRGMRLPRTRSRSRAAVRVGKLLFKRGLYDVANLCYLFESLGYQVDWAKWEAAIEGDDSNVPGMLLSILHDLGEALLAMAEEEVAEALAGRDVEPDAPDDDDDDVLVAEERKHIAAAKTPALRAFRRGLAHAKLRSGKTLSAKTVKALRGMMTDHESAIEETRSAIRKHKKALGALSDMLDGSDGDETDDEVEANAAQDGDGEDTERSFRKRQAEVLALTHTP